MDTKPRSRTLQVIDTKLYADTVEWCPFKGSEDVLLCGTYQLLETSEDKAPSGEPQVRVGQLYVFSLGINSCGTPALFESHSISMPGILDIKWARQCLDKTCLCGLVNSVGELQLWTMGKDKCENTEEVLGQKLAPELLKTMKISNCIGLSLDWDAPIEGSVPRVVISDSTGGLSVFEVSPGCVSILSQWHAHDFEAWICAFDQWNPQTVYSGSDDCKMKIWDLRVGTSPVSINSRFTMGVCSIQSSSLRDHLLAVGSYDEHLRIFDTRKMCQPVSTVSLGGGVWRVKWDPFCANYILTATMHNGFHVVDCSKPDADPLPVLAHYTNHSSLAYGVDWCRLKSDQLPGSTKRNISEETDEAEEHFLLASCSFYDHSLQVWQWT